MNGDNNMQTFPITIVEGCDCSGKSTLIKQLMAAHPNNCYIHNAVAEDIYALHKNTIDIAIEASKHHWVFIDRLHLSEKVYGMVFRNGPSYDVELFDKTLDSIPNLKRILCMVDKDTVLKIHASRKDIEMFDNVSRVWDLYNEVTSWHRYNWKTDNIDLNTLEITPKVNIGGELA